MTSINQTNSPYASSGFYSGIIETSMTTIDKTTDFAQKLLSSIAFFAIGFCAGTIGYASAECDNYNPIILALLAVATGFLTAISAATIPWAD